MAAQQTPLEIPGIDRFSPEVRRAALRLLANAGSAEYLPAVADDTITHQQSHLTEILKFLAVFGYEATRQIHGQNDGLTARFISDELDTAEFAQLLGHVEQEASEW